jgi:hypothetical protein
MPPISNLGTIVTVTPAEELQIAIGPSHSEFVNDLAPFSMCVAGTIRDDSGIVGVYGPVTGGAERYQGLVATLFVRCDNSDWTRDNRSGANFKVGRTAATLNGKHPFYHPDGSDVPYPFIIRFGSLDSRVDGEPEINTAKEMG